MWSIGRPTLVQCLVLSYSDKGEPPGVWTIEAAKNFEKSNLLIEDPLSNDLISNIKREARGEVFVEHRTESVYCSTYVNNLKLSLCFSCKEISLWKYDTVIFPHARLAIEPNSDLDADIKADFEEARDIVNLSPRGAAALLRLCIQKLCKQLGKPGKNINDDIAALVKEGLEVSIQQALDVVRVVGNEAVHPGEMDLKDDREIALQLFNLVNIIAENRLTQPKKIAELFAKLPAEKIKGIAKRDGRVP